MKKAMPYLSCASLMIALLFAAGSAGGAEISGASSIETVTIYQNRCMISRAMAAEVVPGLTTWRFPDLPIQILDESVRVSGRGTAAARIVDIRVLRSRGSDDVKAGLKDLEKKKKDIEARLKEVRDGLEVQGKKAELVRSLSVLRSPDDKTPGAAPVPGSEEWKRRLDFIDVELTKILDQTRRLNAEKSDLEEKAQAVAQELDQRSGLLVTPRKTVLVDIEVTKAGTEKLSLSYVVPGVTWSPSYDLRIDSQKDEATLAYQALVSQDTGEDWSNVQLSLSTAEPALQSVPRRLTAWQVETASSLLGSVSCRVTDRENNPLPGTVVTLTSGGFRKSLTADSGGRVLFPNLNPGTYDLKAELAGFKSVLRGGVEVRPGRSAGLDLSLEQAALEEQVTVDTKVSYAPMAEAPAGAPEPESEAEIATAQAGDRTVATVFEVKQRQDIPSSREKKKVTIAVETLPVEKEFLSAPKIAETVFLNARITNATDIILLPGRASLFYDNDFVATADVPLLGPGDRFSVGAGEVPGVKVRRRMGQARTETGLTSKKVQLTYDVVITVENLQRVPRTIVVRDQIPVTSSKDVAIEVLETSPDPSKDALAEDEAREGILAWPVQLGPLEKKEIKFRFRVTHPKGRPLISGLP